MKLFAVPGACSLAPHIIIKELGLPCEIRIIHSKNPDDWTELRKLNPLAQVPTLITDEGYTLTEGPAIMQYLLSKAPNSLFPASGKARFQAFEWMNFLSSALHRSFATMFKPASVIDDEAQFEAVRTSMIKKAKAQFQVAEDRFSDGEFALGSQFSVVDAYLFVIASWSAHFKIDLSPYPKLDAFCKRMAERPAVQAAKQAEAKPA